MGAAETHKTESKGVKVMDILPIDELIAHCDRVLEKHTSGTLVYQEHESVRHHLQVLRQYRKLEMPVNKLTELVGELKANHIILTPFAVGQPVYVARSHGKKTYVVEHIDIFDEDCPIYYCYNPSDPKDRFCFDGDEIGETVFSTPEEADAASVDGG